MPNHAPFITVGNGSPLQFTHLGERTLHRRFHLFKKMVCKLHAADIERKPDPGTAAEMILITIP